MQLGLGLLGCLMPLSVTVQLSGLLLEVRLRVKLGLVDVDKEEDDETDKTHAEEEDERHVGVSTGSSGDTSGCEGTNEAGSLADSVEESEEEVGFGSGNDLGQEGNLVRCPGSHLELYESDSRTDGLIDDLRSKLERPRIPILLISGIRNNGSMD